VTRCYRDERTDAPCAVCDAVLTADDRALIDARAALLAENNRIDAALVARAAFPLAPARKVDNLAVMALVRLTAAGKLVRVRRGVYAKAGSPAAEAVREEPPGDGAEHVPELVGAGVLGRVRKGSGRRPLHGRLEELEPDGDGDVHGKREPEAALDVPGREVDQAEAVEEAAVDLAGPRDACGKLRGTLRVHAGRSSPAAAGSQAPAAPDVGSLDISISIDWLASLPQNRAEAVVAGIKGLLDALARR